MRYLTKKRVIQLNKATVDAHDENLDYLIEAVQV